MSLKRHLADPQTVQILARAFSPFEQPTSQSKSSFETKTSAINVTPSSHARYDIKQIREDTLWLSKQTNIDEVSALRISIIEWQTRPFAQLLRGGIEEHLAFQNGDGGAGSFRASVLDAGSSLFAKSTTQEKESSPPFEESGARYRRLLEVYLSERRCILKCSEFITFVALNKPEGNLTSTNDQVRKKSQWLEEVGVNILSSWNFGGETKGDRRHPVIEAVAALRSRLESMTHGSGWLQDEGVQDDIELAWARSQILEMIHIMQITFNLLKSVADLVKSSAILSWFRLMHDCEFCEGVQLVSR